MTETASKNQILLARLAVVLVIVLIVAGFVWSGFSTDVRQRIWQNLLDRPFGPMMFRFILQPVMAALVALRDGIADARSGRGIYFWTILTNPAERSGRLREGLIASARIILLGLGMDAIYQFVVLKTFHPGEAAIAALLLAFLPYVLLRGPFARLAYWWRGDAPANEIR